MRVLSIIFAVLGLLACGVVGSTQDECRTIGIDLGTTYSVVAAHKNGNIKIIPNEFDKRITPSIVSFTDDKGTLIGEAARSQAIINSRRTFYAVKRLIGRRITDEEVEEDKKLLPYSITEKNGKPYIETTFNGKKKLFSPEQISAMVLGKMKDIAEKFLGHKVKDAVITVPAYFNDAQRAATKAAGEIAELNVVRIINEPTAAAMAYGLHIKDKQNVIVFDLGGGTFDVTVLTIDQGVFEVISTYGDTHLGGEDFDNNVVNYLIQLIKKKYNKDISNDKRAVQKLKKEVEKAKRKLSSVDQVKMESDDLLGKEFFSEVLTRTKFEELNNNLFKEAIEGIKTAINLAKLKQKDINEVVLVGGSTRIPKIRALIKEFFNGKKLHTDINPDEAIAYGAAIQAAILCQNEAISGESGLLLLDKTPLTLGIETIGEVITELIPRQTIIPTRAIKMFTTVFDQQTSVHIQVYEGERPKSKDNHLLGDFLLTDIPPAPAGKPQIEVTFHIDANSILRVTAKNKDTGKGKSMVVSNKERLSKDDIHEMIGEARILAEQDRIIRERTQTAIELKNKIFEVNEELESLKSKLSDHRKKEVKDAIQQAQEELNMQEDVAYTEQHIMKLRNALETLENVSSRVFSKDRDSHLHVDL